jgi:hypothetical protein
MLGAARTKQLHACSPIHLAFNHHKQPGIDVVFPRLAGVFSGALDSEIFHVRRRLRQLNRVDLKAASLARDVRFD